jgi:hypothetical protein
VSLAGLRNFWRIEHWIFTNDLSYRYRGPTLDITCIDSGRSAPGKVGRRGSTLRRHHKHANIGLADRCVTDFGTDFKSVFESVGVKYFSTYFKSTKKSVFRTDSGQNLKSVPESVTNPSQKQMLACLRGAVCCRKTPLRLQETNPPALHANIRFCDRFVTDSGTDFNFCPKSVLNTDFFVDLKYVLKYLTQKDSNTDLKSVPKSVTHLSAKPMLACLWCVQTAHFFRTAIASPHNHAPFRFVAEANMRKQYRDVSYRTVFATTSSSENGPWLRVRDWRSLRWITSHLHVPRISKVSFHCRGCTVVDF